MASFPFLRRTSAAAAALAIAAAILLSASPAAATPSVSGEVGGGSVAARAATQALRGGWATAVLAGTDAAAPAPIVLTAADGTPIAGTIGTTAAGTTIAVQRIRCSADRTNPTCGGPSPNPGTATCTGGGLTLQGSAPRPASLAGAGCPAGIGTAYSEVGGTGESTTRDAVEFSFSRPVWGFGAWFGDLETRTDGLGVPAIVRLLDAGGAVLEEFWVDPGGDQSQCGNASNGCGNNTTRFVGFTEVLASRMIVIVGDEDATGTALDEGMGFIGPAAVDAVLGLTAAVDATAVGPVSAGAIVTVPVLLANNGLVELSDLTGLDCSPAVAIPAGGSLPCSTQHAVTQEEIDAGTMSIAVSATGSWTGLTATGEDVADVPLVRAPAFSVALAADRAAFSEVGEVIGWTATATNAGNTTAAPDSVAVTDVSLSCLPAGAVAPGATIVCTGTLTTTSGADVVRTATVAWSAGSAPSEPVTIAWEPPPTPPPAPTPEPIAPAGIPGLGSGSPAGGAAIAAAAIALGAGLIGCAALRRRARGRRSQPPMAFIPREG